MKIGITERGDASIDYSWVDKLNNVDGAIIITKNLNEKLQTKILESSKPIIVHCTCTGWGGSYLEPNVPDYKEQLNNLKSLIDKGFLKSHCVLRIDPIIPTIEGIERVKNVLDYAKDLYLFDTIRIRISIMDEYQHVKNRLREIGKEPFYGDKFYANSFMMKQVANLLNKYNHIFETCAEMYLSQYANCFEGSGCVGKKDLEIMGLEIPNNLLENMQNRKGCHCLSCKTELLSCKNRCPHQCLYCYWKD